MLGFPMRCHLDECVRTVVVKKVVEKPSRKRCCS